MSSTGTAPPTLTPSPTAIRSSRSSGAGTSTAPAACSKAAPYKGLNIAFGRDDVFAGILIRGVAALAEPRTLLDGPCMCVDHLLEVTGHPTIQSLLNTFDRSIDPSLHGPPSPLALHPAAEPRADLVCEGPRVGLTLKRGALADRARFLARPYRFLTEPARIKKGRLHVVIGLHRQGQGPDAIATRTGSTLAQIRKYIEHYEAGTRRTPDEICQGPRHRGDLPAARRLRPFSARSTTSAVGWLSSKPCTLGHAEIGGERVHGDVVGLGGQVGEDFIGEAEPDPERQRARAHRREGEVVVALAVAEAQARGGEREAGQQREVNVGVGERDALARARLRQPERGRRQEGEQSATATNSIRWRPEGPVMRGSHSRLPAASA